MAAITAIYENGDFRPLDPVDLPEGSTVRIEPVAAFEEEELTPEEKLFLLAESGRRAGWDAPEMDDYDNYDEKRKKLCP